MWIRIVTHCKEELELKIMELELDWKNGIDPNPGKWQSRESTGMFGKLMAIYYIMLEFIQNHFRIVILMKTCMISLKMCLKPFGKMWIFVVIQILWSFRKYIDQKWWWWRWWIWLCWWWWWWWWWSCNDDVDDDDDDDDDPCKHALTGPEPGRCR